MSSAQLFPAAFAFARCARAILSKPLAALLAVVLLLGLTPALTSCDCHSQVGLSCATGPDPNQIKGGFDHGGGVHGRP